MGDDSIKYGQKYLRQKEVARRWCCSESTIINYRKNGKLPYFIPPGSDRPLYPLDQIEKIEAELTQNTKEVKPKKTNVGAEIKRNKPVMSATEDNEWRI